MHFCIAFSFYKWRQQCLLRRRHVVHETNACNHICWKDFPVLMTNLRLYRVPVLRFTALELPFYVIAKALPSMCQSNANPTAIHLFLRDMWQRRGAPCYPFHDPDIQRGLRTIISAVQAPSTLLAILDALDIPTKLWRLLSITQICLDLLRAHHLDALADNYPETFRLQISMWLQAWKQRGQAAIVLVPFVMPPHDTTTRRELRTCLDTLVAAEHYDIHDDMRTHIGDMA